MQIREGGGGGHPDPEIKGEPGLTLVLTLETSEMSPIFCFHNQNNSTSSPGLLCSSRAFSQSESGKYFE